MLEKGKHHLHSSGLCDCVSRTRFIELALSVVGLVTYLIRSVWRLASRSTSSGLVV